MTIAVCSGCKATKPLQQKRLMSVMYFMSNTKKTLQYFFCYETEIFFLPKQCQTSRPILKDGSRSLRFFRKGIIAEFHRTGLIICGHSREGKTSFYNQINMVQHIKVQSLKKKWTENQLLQLCTACTAWSD